MGPTISIRSRSGNVALATLGAIYAASAVLLAGLFLRDVWQAMAVEDAGMTFLLILSAICGGWFVSLAVQRLGRRSRSHRGHDVHAAAAR